MPLNIYEFLLHFIRAYYSLGENGQQWILEVFLLWLLINILDRELVAVIPIWFDRLADVEKIKELSKMNKMNNFCHSFIAVVIES